VPASLPAARHQDWVSKLTYQETYLTATVETKLGIGYRIEESLWPSPLSLQVTAEYLRLSIKGQAAKQKHTKNKWNQTFKRVVELQGDIEEGELDATQMNAQYEELQKKKTELSEDWEEHMHLLKDMERACRALAETDSHEPWRHFKSSAAKKELNLGVLPTNLQIHCALIIPKKVDEGHTTVPQITSRNASSLHIGRMSSENFWADDEEVEGDVEHAVEVYTVTIGAATAICLKSKQGGLKRLNEKMEKMINQNKKDGVDDLWLSLDIDALSLELSRRSIMAMGQALSGGVSCAALEIAGHIRHEDWAALEMLLDIGLLVHWASLLSTYGGEITMIEDMAVVAPRLGNVSVTVVTARPEEVEACKGAEDPRSMLQSHLGVVSLGEVPGTHHSLQPKPIANPNAN